MGANPDFDYLFDPQQRCPVRLCVNCGREIYGNHNDLCDLCKDVENDLEDNYDS